MVATDWVSFKDLLPEPGQKVIVTFDGVGCIDLTWTCPDTRATHWMPFVPPPPPIPMAGSGTRLENGGCGKACSTPPNRARPRSP